MTRYNINALYLREIVPPRAIREAMPTTTPADPVVEEDRVCPECGSEHLVRDYTRGELVCDSCGLVISESAIDEGPEWAAYSVEENDRLARTGARTRPRPLERRHRRRRGVRRVPDRRRAADPRRVATGDGRPEEDDRQGLRRPPADPHPPSASVAAVRLRESLLLATRPEQRGRGRVQQDSQGTREDRQLDVLVPLGD